MNHILQPGAYAHIPLSSCLTAKTVQFPLTFIYGGRRDWMDSRHGQKVLQSLHAGGRMDCRLHVVASSGHQLPLDSPMEFVSLVVKEAMSSVELKT
jgi:pimeloyl-ACP methyl ester carboxylesterase